MRMQKVTSETNFKRKCLDNWAEVHLNTFYTWIIYWKIHPMTWSKEHSSPLQGHTVPLPFPLQLYGGKDSCQGQSAHYATFSPSVCLRPRVNYKHFGRLNSCSTLIHFHFSPICGMAQFSQSAGWSWRTWKLSLGLKWFRCISILGPNVIQVWGNCKGEWMVSGKNFVWKSM